MPQIQLIDGKKIKFDKSINGFDLTKKISKSLEKIALIMEVDGDLKDLSYLITKDAKVRIITAKDKVTAVCVYKVPLKPLIKISGINTATKTNVVAIIANDTCFEPL